MFVTVHTITGVAIASVIPDPIISVPFAFGSHFILDSIPHWHDIKVGQDPTKKTYILSLIDILAAIVISAFMVTNLEIPYLWLVILSSTVMDTDVILYPFFEKKGWRNIWPKAVSKIHGNIQNETENILGLLTQILIFIFGLIIVLQ